MIVAGLDEVGRGSLAGPLLVVAAAFEMEKWDPSVPCPIPKVRDSKRYASRRPREWAAASIEKESSFLGRGRGIVTSVDITERGMTWAVRAAFLRAVTNLPVVPDLVLVDGDTGISGWDGPQEHIPKADSLWWPVSAASVLAKVERDRWMVELGRVYPNYAFHENAGYGTEFHRHAIRKHGTTPAHRLGFIHFGKESVDEGKRADRASSKPAP